MTLTIFRNRMCRILVSSSSLFVALAAIAPAASSTENRAGLEGMKGAARSASSNQPAVIRPATELSTASFGGRTTDLGPRLQAASVPGGSMGEESLPRPSAVEGVALGGLLSWSISGFTVDLKAGSICNNAPGESFTGTLRLELWAFSSPFFAGEPGYKLGQSANLTGLTQGFCYNNYDSGLRPLLVIPPDGVYYTVMFIDEFTNAGTNDGFSYDDYFQFSATITVSGGVIFNTPISSCTANATTLCIDDQTLDRRFRVQVSFATSQGTGASGNGQAISLSSLGVPHGGLLWFFSADNPELLIKVLPACAVNGHHWVFASAGTNVGLTITVTDTSTGAQRVYTNADFHAMTPIQDTGAFTCP
jgi:hypothetical protein